MAERWVLNASPLIVLAQINQIDDKAARKCARSFSIRVKGTLGVIILARQRGLIPSAADLLRELRRNGFRLDDRLIRETLRRTVGEAW
jgi:predicted nucleic acid-binding protein